MDSIKREPIIAEYFPPTSHIGLAHQGLKYSLDTLLDIPFGKLEILPSDALIGFDVAESYFGPELIRHLR